MPDPSGINPLVGRVAPPQPMPDFNEALGTQANYEQLTAYRKARVDAASDAAATQTALQQAGGDIPTALDILGKSGKVNALGALQKGWDDHQAKAQTLAKQHLDMQVASHELAADWAHALIGHPERFAAAKQALSPELGNVLGDQYDEARLQTIADSSKQGAQWNKDAAAALAQAPKDLESAVRLSAGLAANAPDQASWDSIPAYYESIGYKQLGAQVRRQLGAFSPENKARVASMALTPEQQQQATERKATAAEAAARDAETNRHNRATEANAASDLAIKQQAANPFGSGSAQTAAAPAGPPLAPGERNAAALTTLPKGVSDTVRLVGDYKMALPTGMALKTPYWQGILAKAAEYNPTFDASQYATRAAVRRDFTSGKTADSIQALNTAVGHLDTLQKDAIALDNFDFTPFNTIRNAALKLGGDSRPGQLNEAANALAMELTKAYRGAGGSEADIEKWRQSFDGAGSPGQLKDNINQAVKLLGGLLDSIGSKYERGMGEPLNFGILNPKAQAVLDRIAPGVVHDVPGAKTGSDATGTGIKVVGKDGVTYTFPSQDKADAFKKAGG